MIRFSEGELVSLLDIEIGNNNPIIEFFDDKALVVASEEGVVSNNEMVESLKGRNMGLKDAQTMIIKLAALKGDVEKSMTLEEGKTFYKLIKFTTLVRKLKFW